MALFFFAGILNAAGHSNYDEENNSKLREIKIVHSVDHKCEQCNNHKFYHNLAKDAASTISNGLYYAGSALLAGGTAKSLYENKDMLLEASSYAASIMMMSLNVADYLIRYATVSDNAQLILGAGATCLAVDYLFDTCVNKYLVRKSPGHMKEE